MTPYIQTDADFTDARCQAVSSELQLSGHRRRHIPSSVFSQALASKRAHAAANQQHSSWLSLSSLDVIQIPSKLNVLLEEIGVGGGCFYIPLILLPPPLIILAFVFSR